MKPTLVVNAVGLTEQLLQKSMPKLQAWATSRQRCYVRPDLPAVTCTAQASMLTGKRPGGDGHGAVANGWYFRDLAEVWLWRQSVGLLTAPTLLQEWRRQNPDSTTAQIFWWWNLPSHADYSITPRPTYWADGRKGPDIHSHPPQLRQRLTQKLGAFPLFQFWGPAAGIASSRWIIDATLEVLQHEKPGLTLCYLPHLDYDLQRFGPASPQADVAAGQLDEELHRLLSFAEEQAMEVIVLSEYGIEAVERAVEPNRALRKAGLLEIHPAQNGALLDPGNSRAFAVCDHQCAHVYVSDQNDLQQIIALLQALPGVDRVYQQSEFAEIGLDHERSGELFLVAEAGSWFAYPYWIEGDQEPDFARTVDIHRKPGYDPCELFLDPQKPLLKARIIAKILAKKAGLRMTMNVVPLDTSLVRGSHGRLPSSDAQGPIWLGPEEWAPSDRNWMTAQETLRALFG